MRCGLLKATNDLQFESDPAMTPDQLRERIRDLTSLCANHPDEYGVLSSGERLMVAYTLNRIDWLRADGCSSLDASAIASGSTGGSPAQLSKPNAQEGCDCLRKSHMQPKRTHGPQSSNH